MSCERFLAALGDAASGPSSPELESHLSGCEPCRAALAAERALLDRIDAELQDSLETQPSLAFLPAARRRVVEVKARREATRRWWLVPALATLVGVLLAGHFVRDTTRGPAAAGSTPLIPAAPPSVATGDRVEPPPSRDQEVPGPMTRPEPVIARSSARGLVPEERVEPASRRAPEPAPPPTGPELAVASSRPRVFVPAEDERAVRRLARRLRGHAARAMALAPGSESLAARLEAPFDFSLEPVAAQREVVSLDDRLLQGAEPVLAEPPSFDLTVEKAGRET